MSMEDTTSCEYHLKRIIMRDAHEEDTNDAEAALEALKLFAIELAGLMAGLEERLVDLEEEIYMSNLMRDEDD